MLFIDVSSRKRNWEFVPRFMVGMPLTMSHDPYEFVESEKSSMHSLSVSHVAPSVCSEAGHISSKNVIKHLSEVNIL